MATTIEAKRSFNVPLHAAMHRRSVAASPLDDVAHDAREPASIMCDAYSATC
jgi:hypothetical protein